ncbi:hypothetical protein O5O45_19960 [Hahella aquimaris]|uniref:hypothetical protein n=1 Tax=Hahella sp. HNIBRBA332 TaxID=3015983 RepID=UPI00273CC1E5|nr:hypothetical protein [Hahella sp. HNIBRBA332]WLQ12006.1 hypothetical protein O5O45_19960 [Hahella sp. HNIBRBA332]
MNNPILTRDDLLGGKLAEIMSYYMLQQDADRKDFLNIARKQKGKFEDKAKRVEALFGYPVPAEVIEAEECMTAYNRYSGVAQDVWMLAGEMMSLPNKVSAKDITTSLRDFELIMRLLTGLEIIGRDPSGDTCFLNMLPSPLGTARVIVYDHETGEPSSEEYFSIADFVADRWEEDCQREPDDEDMDDEDEDDEEDEDEEEYEEDFQEEEWFSKHSDAAKQAIEDFNSFSEAEIKQRPYYHDPKQLFSRSDWLHGHPSGRPTYAFASKMDQAPTFEVYEREKPLLDKEPVLANYWMLAHFFLGNHAACRDTINLVKQANAPGSITQALAEALDETLTALETKPDSAKFGRLDHQKITDLISQTQANCSPEHLEPKHRTALLEARGETQIKRLKPEECQQRLANGVDPLTLIEEYPDDVATHDLALAALAEQDSEFNKIVTAYFKERTRDAFNEWPYERQPELIDKRLSLPLAAAFKSGLKYDADHKKAYSGITQTLGKYDDDNAMAALEAAVSQLPPDDDRLKYVIQCLQGSKHPRRNEMMGKAAWRLFDILEAALKNQQEQAQQRREEGPTLDNMIDVKNHYLTATHIFLQEGSSEALQVADKLLGNREHFRLFKHILGDAFRLAGNHDLKEHAEFAKYYVTRVAAIEVDDTEMTIEDLTLLNYIEAAIAWCKLDPKAAKATAKKLFKRKTESAYFDLEIKSGQLYALLEDDKDNAELLGWARRLLGNRSNATRICGPLRAAGELKLTSLMEDVRYHLYSGYNDLFPEQVLLKEIAWDSYRALNEDCAEAPTQRKKDQFASYVDVDKLADALGHPERHDLDHVCKRIYKENHVSPEAIPALSQYLTDLLQYSGDDTDRVEAREGLRALRIQGVNAQPVLASLLQLEHMATDHFNSILYTMRFVEPEASLREWLYGADLTELLAQLANPAPRFLPWLDLIAAHAVALTKDQDSEPLLNALSQAMDHRLSFPLGDWSDEEPTLIRLPQILSRFKGDKRIDSSLKKFKRCIDKADLYPLNASSLSRRRAMPDANAFQVSKGETIRFKQPIKGPDDDEAIYTLTITPTSDSVMFECGVHNLYFRTCMEDEELKSAGQIPLQNENAALSLARSMAFEAMILGYNQDKPVPKKTKKRG